MLAGLVLVYAAAADVPEGVRPVLAATNAPARYAEAAKRAQRQAPPLHCVPLVPDAVDLCFRVWEGGKRRWVHTTDLAAWGVSSTELTAEMSRRGAAFLASASMVRVEGLPARYLRLADGDGWAAAMLLHPQSVAQRLGGVPIRVAAPSPDVALAYRPAGDALDKVMAIGVRELHDTANVRVAPGVFAWDGTTWMRWGQAIPKAN